MSMDQIYNIAVLALVAVTALLLGISTALKYYTEKMVAEGKTVPHQVVSAQEAADALYSEANKLLDFTGAQKKAWGTEQLQKQKPGLTKEVAAGLIQKSYDTAHASNNQETSDSEETTQPIGFLDSGDDSNGSAKA